MESEVNSTTGAATADSDNDIAFAYEEMTARFGTARVAEFFRKQFATQPTSGKQEEWAYERGHPNDIWIICVGGFPKWSVQGEAVAKGICDAHSASIKAEREKAEKLGWLLLDANKRLAALQAAMKQIATQPFTYSGAMRVAENALSCDTTALDAAIAAAHQPLVDALNTIKNTVCGDRHPNWTNDFQITHTRGWIADIIDAALAKVKGHERPVYQV